MPGLPICFLHSWNLRLTVLLALLSCGCVNSLKDTVSARDLPRELAPPSRDGLVAIDFTALGQKPVAAHRIGANDILGIYIHGILGNGQEIDPEIEYPPQAGEFISGDLASPSAGCPVTVNIDGTISLPMAPEIDVGGLTLVDAAGLIRKIYTDDRKLLQPGRNFVSVCLIKPRAVQVSVLREDSINRWPIFKQNNATLATKRGSGKDIELPVYTNDVLHALTESGGLPGTDAGDEIWVFRQSHPQDLVPTASSDEENQESPEHATPKPKLLKIPLKIGASETLHLSESDLILESGDVVYVPGRDREHFFVGGVLMGQQVYLPRDYELDVISAIAMAGGSVAGPPNGGGLFASRSPGVIFPPTRVLILRKAPGHEQVTIHVDLKRAMKGRSERIAIQPGDVILLQFTPCQIAGNVLLNAFRFRMGINRGFFTSGGEAARNFSTLPPP